MSKEEFKQYEEEFNKIFARNLRYYLERNNMTQLELSKKLDVGTTSVYNWCNAIKTPRMDKVDKMCSIFGIQRSDLMDDKSTTEESYYTNKETQQLAQEIFDNPDLKMLFDTTRDCSPEDMKKVISMVKAFKGEL